MRVELGLGSELGLVFRSLVRVEFRKLLFRVFVERSCMHCFRKSRDLLIDIPSFHGVRVRVRVRVRDLLIDIPSFLPAVDSFLWAASKLG